MKQSMMEIANTVVGFERNKEEVDSKPLKLERWKDEDLKHLKKWVGEETLHDFFDERIKIWRDLLEEKL